MTEETIIKLPARRFRTILRIVAGSLHFAQALRLLKARSGTGLELLIDDVNKYVMMIRLPVPSNNVVM
jgi:hypothetical protein